jgi:hypothetical protein
MDGSELLFALWGDLSQAARLASVRTAKIIFASPFCASVITVKPVGNAHVQTPSAQFSPDIQGNIACFLNNVKQGSGP